MFTFKDYLHQSTPILTEAVKNPSLAHLEDDILNVGLSGAKTSLNFLKGITGMLLGHADKKYNITTKWDGAPAVIFGIDPQSKKFFVGTKAVFRKKEPKILYTQADVDKWYGDIPELADQLSSALKYLSKLGVKGIYQGDMMFHKNGVQHKTIEGQEYVVFKPNTIAYAIPANSDLASEVQKAKFGIVVHTKYTGPAINELSSSFKVSLKSFKKTPDIWLTDASYADESGTVTLTAAESKAVTQHILQAEEALKSLSKSNIEAVLSHKTFISMMKVFVNSQVRQGKYFSNINQMVTDLHGFLKEKISREKSTDEAKERKIQKYQKLLADEKDTVTKLFTFQSHVNAAKLALIKKLHKADSIGTFLKDGDGYKVTAPEGFVAVDHLTNKAMKLVDRLEFSKANFHAH